MPSQSLITEELRQAIGVQGPPLTTEIEKGAIRRFAEAIDDASPLWQDEPQARKTRYGGIIAPPTFLRSIASHALEIPVKLPLTHLLDAGSEWEYFEPVRPGDLITAVTKLVDAFQREGRAGAMLFTVNETTYANQFGEVVAIQKTTLIRY